MRYQIFGTLVALFMYFIGMLYCIGAWTPGGRFPVKECLYLHGLVTWLLLFVYIIVPKITITLQAWSSELLGRVNVNTNLDPIYPDKAKVCPFCEGSGMWINADDEEIVCPFCDGVGIHSCNFNLKEHCSS